MKNLKEEIAESSRRDLSYKLDDLDNIIVQQKISDFVSADVSELVWFTTWFEIWREIRDNNGKS